MEIIYRPGTSDEKVMGEIFKNKVYEKYFKIESTDRWLDLGANFGAFSYKCLLNGCYVKSVEPEPSNFQILSQNCNKFKNGKYDLINGAVSHTPTETKLYLAKNPDNHWRHTLFKIRGRKTIDVKIYSIDELLDNSINAIKIDIEGSEIEILENITQEQLKNVNKLAFEYSFDKDKSIPRFIKIIDKLKIIFKNVNYTKVKPDELEYNYFPACCMCYCYN